MRTFKFNEPNYEMLGKGKISTVRKGVKSDLSIGSRLRLENEQSGEAVSVTVRKIEFTMVMDLTSSHAVNDGFSCVSDLVEELEECYGGSFNSVEIVTVITFNHIGKAPL